MRAKHPEHLQYLTPTSTSRTKFFERTSQPEDPRRRLLLYLIERELNSTSIYLLFFIDRNYKIPPRVKFSELSTQNPGDFALSAYEETAPIYIGQLHPHQFSEIL